MQLDRDAALLALEKIARPLGLDTVGAAWGIHQVVNENMANAARVHAVERGKDPRLPPLRLRWGRPRARLQGGSGPGCPWLYSPLGAGATSAFGFLCTPLSFDFVRSLYGRLDDLGWSEVNAALGEMEKEGRNLLRASGITDETWQGVSARCATWARDMR